MRNLNAEVTSEIWFANAEIGATPIKYELINYTEETSVTEMRFNADNVLKRLIDRLASAFGIWRR